MSAISTNNSPTDLAARARTEPQAAMTASRLGQSNRDPDNVVIRRGREAFDRIASERTWNDWLAIGEALQHLRAAAMRDAFTNQPVGSAYNEAFGLRLQQHGFDRLDKGDRWRLLECMQHRDEIEAWRSTVPLNKRLQWNHPATVLRRWKATQVIPGAAKKPSAYAQLRDDHVRMIDENTRLQREIASSGGDLWAATDRAEDIARVMATKLSTTKLQNTARAMLAIVKQRKCRN
jgi:hypothetical protein